MTPENIAGLVSVVIPHRNRAKLLQETLDSLRLQSTSNWEAIVVDHDSTPEEQSRAEAVVLDCPQARFLLRTDGSPGPSASRNLGLHEAQGEFLIFLDSDDLLSPTCLERRIRTIKGSKGVDFAVFPAWLFETAPGDLDAQWNGLSTGTSADDLIQFLESHAPWCVSGPIWRIDSIRKIGGFNETVFYGDDAELHIRALVKGLRYQKVLSDPDHYIRRSPEVARATQGHDPVVERSREHRLTAITSLLKAEGAWQDYRRVWTGQYFSESEFYLFQKQPKPEARRLISNTLQLWKKDCRPPFFHRIVASSYHRIALASRDRAYLVLRIARRLAMVLLPAEYFGRKTLG